MKLFYSPGACSLSPHIALREAGLAFDLARVDTKTATFDGGGDFTAINPKGYVPALQLDDGQVLTEGAAIAQYIADLRPDAGLAPKAGTLERARLQEWLVFIASELHQGFTPLFRPGTPEDYKPVADGYLFTVLGWCGYVGLDLAKWPVLKAYHARIGARPKVLEALKAEGLVK
jgi:glutathione S-transferase